MHMFNAVIRLQGAIGNEVMKFGLTVPEIVILQHIHGSDGVAKLEHRGVADIDDADERERLIVEYNEGLLNLGDEHKTSVEKLFGGEYNPLPHTLRSYKGELGTEEGYLEDFQEPPYVVDEDVGITPMEKARQRRAEAGQRALAKREALAAGEAPAAKNKPPAAPEAFAEPKAARNGKSAIEAAL